MELYMHTLKYLLFFSYSVVSNFLRAHILPHARLPWASLSPGVCSNSCPLSWWCHSTISSTVAPFSCCPQSFPASVGCLHQVAKALELQLQYQSWINEYSGWFPLGLTGLITWLSNELSRVFSSTTVWKHQFFSAQPSLWSNFHICTWLLEKS